MPPLLSPPDVMRTWYFMESQSASISRARPFLSGLVAVSVWNLLSFCWMSLYCRGEEESRSKKRGAEEKGCGTS